MKVCLDTNIIVYYLKGMYPHVLTQLQSHLPNEILIPEIVRAELFFGVAQSQQTERNLERLNAFLAPFERLPFAGDAVERYADIRADLAMRGQSIGPNDLLIAATTRAHG
ncbi:MAG: tRNA(fMet)-specific endonuclease VapC, partial [Lentimonas sp.]